MTPDLDAILSRVLKPIRRRHQCDHGADAVALRSQLAKLGELEYQRPLPGLESRALKDQKGRTVALIDGAVAVDVALRGLEKLGTPVGHRFLDALGIRAWEQYEASSQDSGIVVFDGGLAGVAAAIDHNNDTAALRALIAVGPSVQWIRPGAHGGGLWTWSLTRGGPGKPGQMRFTLGDALRPGFLVALEEADKAHTPAARAARRGIPILRRAPPVGSLNERSHGAVYIMGRLLLVEMVDGAEELHLNGGLKLNDKRWSEMAKRAGLPSVSLSRLRDAWLSGDDSSKAPPLIKEVGGGLVTLGDAHELERLFIAERGRRAIEGRRVARLRKKGSKGKT